MRIVVILHDAIDFLESLLNAECEQLNDGVNILYFEEGIGVHISIFTVFIYFNLAYSLRLIRK